MKNVLGPKVFVKEKKYHNKLIKEKQGKYVNVNDYLDLQRIKPIQKKNEFGDYGINFVET
jgi:hypothetical protein